MRISDWSSDVCSSDLSQLAADVDFGGGADILTMAEGTAFSGKLSNSAGVAATIGGTFDPTNTGNVALASLDVGAKGVLGVPIDRENDTHPPNQITVGRPSRREEVCQYAATQWVADP